MNLMTSVVANLVRAFQRVAIVLAMATACKGSASEPVKVTPAAVLSVVVSPGALSLELGATGAATAAVYSTTGALTY